MIEQPDCCKNLIEATAPATLEAATASALVCMDTEQLKHNCYADMQNRTSLQSAKASKCSRAPHNALFTTTSTDTYPPSFCFQQKHLSGLQQRAVKLPALLVCVLTHTRAYMHPSAILRCLPLRTLLPSSCTRAIELCCYQHHCCCYSAASTGLQLG